MFGKHIKIVDPLYPEYGKRHTESASILHIGNFIRNLKKRNHQSLVEKSTCKNTTNGKQLFGILWPLVSMVTTTLDF